MTKNKQTRTRKTTSRQRRAVCLLYATDEWTMNDIGILFGITQGRVSQIVTNYYGESFHGE